LLNVILEWIQPLVSFFEIVVEAMYDQKHLAGPLAIELIGRQTHQHTLH